MEGIFTQNTCGMNCWLAEEDECRCSCGGANHGIMLKEGNEQPKRMAKIDGTFYELEGIGKYGDIYHQAGEINNQPQYEYHLEKYPEFTYHPKETESGSPARIKIASQKQMEDWPELAPFKNESKKNILNQYYDKPYLLWIKKEMQSQEIQEEPEMEGTTEIKEREQG